MRTDSPITVLAGEDLEPNRRIRFNGTSYVYADAYERHEAITTGSRIVSGRYGPAYAANDDGLIAIEAAGTIAAGAIVNGKDDGKIDDDGAGVPIGMSSLSASAAAGDKVPVLTSALRGTIGSGVKVFTADGVVTAAETGTIITNTAAAGTVVVALPVAVPGLQFYARVSAAQQLRLDPNGTEQISLPSTGVPGAAGKYLVADAIGESVHLVCVLAGHWSVLGFTGTWTAEA